MRNQLAQRFTLRPFQFLIRLHGSPHYRNKIYNIRCPNKFHCFLGVAFSHQIPSNTRSANPVGSERVRLTPIAPSLNEKLCLREMLERAYQTNISVSLWACALWGRKWAASVKFLFETTTLRLLISHVFIFIWNCPKCLLVHLSVDCCEQSTKNPQSNAECVNACHGSPRLRSREGIYVYVPRNEIQTNQNSSPEKAESTLNQ